MNPKKNVIIVSARRSGTHLLTDLIVNNFGYESINKNYLDYAEFERAGLNGFQELIDVGNKVMYTHTHDYKDYYKRNHSNDLGDDEKLDKIFSESKIILVYRDIRDIINSCYHRPKIKKKYESFTDFYENFDFDGYELIDQSYDNIFELLLQYYKNWFSVWMAKEIMGLDMEIISFEEIIEKYDSSVNKIGKFLEQPITNKYFRRKQIVDVRLPNKNNENIIYTTNDFRNGKIDDWINTMDYEFGAKLGERYHIELGIGIKCYLEDTKINKYHIPERDKFLINYKDWNSEADYINNELKQCKIKLEPFDSKNLIKNRYRNAILTKGDFRYFHKVFYYDDYVLKFIYPCKATLDKLTFNTTVPPSSVKQQLAILKTNEILYNLGIVPKLYDVGIYNGVLFIIQERYEASQVLCSKYNIYPKWDDWQWPVALEVYPKMLSHFNKAIEHNILLTDIVNVYNCALDSNGDLKYFDLDGIKLFDTKEDMLNSEDYKNIMGIFSEVEKYC